MVSVCLPSDALLATPTVLLGSLLPWTWGISSQLLQQSQATAPYLGRGYLLTTTPPDLEHGGAPFGPPVPTQRPLLGCGVFPYPGIKSMESCTDPIQATVGLDPLGIKV